MSVSAFPPPQPRYVPVAPVRPFGASNIVALVAAAGLVVGSFLPWVTVRIFLGELSIAGTRGDGKLTAVAGALAVIFIAVGAGQHSRVLLVLGALAAAAGEAVAVYDVMNVSNAVGEAAPEGVTAEVGVGLWLCALCGAVAFVGAMIGQSNVKYES